MEAIQESKLYACKKCDKEVKAFLHGLFDEKNKRWKDENGKNLQGKLCYDCNCARAKENMRKIRFERKQAQEKTSGAA